jgi:hypothetical protein
VAVVVTFLLLLAVLPAYYVVHKPFQDVIKGSAPVISGDAVSVMLALLNLLANFMLLILTLAVVAAWGSRVSRWLGIKFDSELERWALGATLGLGMLGTLVFAVGVAGGLYRWVGYLLLGALALHVLPDIWNLIRCIWTTSRRLQPSSIPWLWLFTGLIGLMALVRALLPPTGWDALVYHLQGPRLYLEAHRLIGVPENFYLNWPAQVEMLFTWGMLLKSDILAKLFHWSFWPLIAAMLYALGRRSAGARAGKWAVALWAAVPLASELAGLAYVDLGLTAFVLAGFYAFIGWSESRRDGWLVLCSLFMGFAMSTKYTAVTWSALLMLLIIYHARRHHRSDIRWILRRAAAFTAIAGLVVLPWLVKNFLVVGNPVYPFLFGGLGWDSTREAWLYWPGQSYSHNILDYLALPWLMTVLGTGGTAAFDATIGPLLLCLVPLILLVRGLPRMLTYGLVLTAAQYVFFAITISNYLYLTETRLLLAVFPFLCLAGAYALDKLPLWDRRAFRLSWVVGVVVSLVLVLTLLTESYAFLVGRPLTPVFGLESGENYLARRLGDYIGAVRYTSESSPDKSRTVYIYEPRGYYGKSNALADTALDNLSQLRTRHGDVGQALIALQAKGFTHLLLRRSGLQFLQASTPRAPTLGTLVGNPPPEQTLYPLTESDLVLLRALITQSRAGEGFGGSYDVYQLP